MIDYYSANDNKEKENPPLRDEISYKLSLDSLAIEESNFSFLYARVTTQLESYIS